MTVRLGPVVCQLERGDLVFYGADSPHHIVCGESPVSFISVHFDWDACTPDPVHPRKGIRNVHEQELVRRPRTYRVHLEGYGELDFPHAASAGDFEAQFVEIVREFDAQKPGYPSVLSGLLGALLVRIARHNAGPPLRGEALAKVRPALEAIREKPTTPWRVDDLARLCNFHPTYFAELFRAGTGESPKRFMVKERISWAKRLLLESGSIESVAEAAGFSSVQYFCRVFRQETGLTPLQYRRQRTAI